VTTSETTTKDVPAETKTNEVPPVGETKDEYEYDSSDEEVRFYFILCVKYDLSNSWLL
jgi:hypothetical protein